MQAGVGYEVAFAGGGYGANVADMLNHGGEGKGRYGEDRGHEQAGIKVRLGEQTYYGILHMEGQAYPGGLLNGGEVNFAADGSHNVGHKEAEQYGDYLYHALAPNVADYYDRDGKQRYEPVGIAVIDGRRGKGEADADYDGAYHDGREEAHNLLHAENLEAGGKYDVH